MCPSVGTLKEYSSPRFLLELEVAHRSIPAADKWCREYFSLIPQLQTVLLIKAFPRRQSGYFGALAVLYKRRHVPGSSNIVVDDAVSFGTEILSDEAKNALRDSASEILDRLRCLPQVVIPAGEILSQNPWKPHNRPYVLLKAADLLHWKVDDDGTPLLLPGLVADANRDCCVELWKVLAVLNDFVTI